MNPFSMAASHAVGKGEKDPAFSVLKKANDAAAKVGKENVVNASVGCIYDESEKFAFLPSVNEYLRQMPAAELMNYAPISGIPEFLDAAVEFTFQAYRPKALLPAVATPGGTGGVRHVFYNYAEQGDKILIPDWFWAPYRTIIFEHKRKMENYRMFDENNKFDIANIKEKSNQLLKEQDSLVVVFNTPGHNPTGYSMSIPDWKEILDFYKEHAANPKKKITILVDLAYVDFVGDTKRNREFLKLFENLPKNILITVAYSMSKSYFLYGMRSGALIGITSSEDVAEEFARINGYSSRGTWSNGTRGAQRLLADVLKDPALKAKTDAERAPFAEMTLKRAEMFLAEAKAVNLTTMPYHGGFFLSIPTDNPEAAADKLAESNVFAVPLPRGLRIAICSVATAKVPGLATKTKEAVKK